MRWNKVRRKNGQVPKHNDFYTPVYSSGDYILWDPHEWCSQYHDALYIAEDANGIPCEPPAVRGLIHRGHLNGRVPDEVKDTEDNTPLFIPGRESQPTFPNLGALIHTALEKASVLPDIRREGLEVPRNLDAWAVLTKQLSQRLAMAAARKINFDRGAQEEGEILSGASRMLESSETNPGSEGVTAAPDNANSDRRAQGRREIPSGTSTMLESRETIPGSEGVTDALVGPAANGDSAEPSIVKSEMLLAPEVPHTPNVDIIDVDELYPTDEEE